MSHRIQLRRDKAAFWAQEDPVLAQGELAWSTDTGELKIGDGTTPWSGLSNILAGEGYTPQEEIPVFTSTEITGNWYENLLPGHFFHIEELEGEDEESTGATLYQFVGVDNSDPENPLPIYNYLTNESYQVVETGENNPVPSNRLNFVHENLGLNTGQNFKEINITYTSTGAGYFVVGIQYITESSIHQTAIRFFGTVDNPRTITFFQIGQDQKEILNNKEFVIFNDSSNDVILGGPLGNHTTFPANNVVNQLGGNTADAVLFEGEITLSPGQFTTVRLLKDSNDEYLLRRSVTQAGSDTGGEGDSGSSSSPAAIVIATPGVFTEVEHSSEPGFESLGTLGQSIFTEDGQVIELSLDYELKPNGTLPQVRIGFAGVGIKLPSGSLPGANDVLHIKANVRLFLEFDGTDHIIHSSIKASAYESYAGGNLVNDVLHFPGDYLGLDSYTIEGGADGSHNLELEFDAEGGVKAKLISAFGYQIPMPTYSGGA